MKARSRAVGSNLGHHDNAGLSFAAPVSNKALFCYCLCLMFVYILLATRTKLAADIERMQISNWPAFVIRKTIPL
jgi:hypothetical protein